MSDKEVTLFERLDEMSEKIHELEGLCSSLSDAKQDVEGYKREFMRMIEELENKPLNESAKHYIDAIITGALTQHSIRIEAVLKKLDKRFREMEKLEKGTNE